MTNVHDFGARGDGKMDNAAALTHAIQRGDGHLVFPRGDYVLSRPLHIPLLQHGRIALEGSGGAARLLMHGAGPALHFVGSHRRSARPADFEATVWDKERMPTIRNLEIVGHDPQADGIRLEGVMQPTLQGVLIRRCRHGIHITQRARNVLIADCHVYDNAGIGIFLDRVNLHQINIHGNHISYCKRGGLVIAGSEIRNIQICSNDIEYNHDLKAETSADVLFDCREGTVREGTLVGNTVQAVSSPGGANVRFLGAGAKDPNAVGLFSITGNLLGSQQTILDLRSCRGVVVAGNSMYSGYHHALWAEDAEHLVIGPNSIDHNPEYKGASTDQVVLRNCRNINMTGILLQHTREGVNPVTSSIDLRGCRNVNLTGLQIVSARVRGIALDDCSTIRIADCTIRGRSDDKTFRSAVAVEKNCSQVMLVNNFLARGSEGPPTIPGEMGVMSGNVVV